VKDGTIALDVPAVLPEGAVVEVVVVSEALPRPTAIPTLAQRYAAVVGIVESPWAVMGAAVVGAQRYAAVVGIVEGLPPALATFHDHDLPGTSRASNE
jgi:hypothetical protein